ncbi:hypothetical protein AB2B38_008580 [Balneola sp. MJW-20]
MLLDSQTFQRQKAEGRRQKAEGKCEKKTRIAVATRANSAKGVPLAKT